MERHLKDYDGPIDFKVQSQMRRDSISKKMADFKALSDTMLEGVENDMMADMSNIPDKQASAPIAPENPPDIEREATNVTNPSSAGNMKNRNNFAPIILILLTILVASGIIIYYKRRN